MKSTPLPTQEDPWAECTFDGAECSQLQQGARMTFAEKVAWLEEAHRISLQFQENRRQRGLPTVYSDGRVEY
jgi:hypothetical protein